MHHPLFSRRMPRVASRLFVLAAALMLAWGIPTAAHTAPLAGEEVRGTLDAWANAPVWTMSSSLGGTFIYNSTQIASCGAERFKFFKSTNAWYGNGATVTFGTILTGLSTSGGDINYGCNSSKYYSWKWNGNDLGALFELSAPPVEVTAVSRTPTNVVTGQVATITATLSATPPAEQRIWLRYALNNNWAGSTVVEMTGSGTTRTADIPAQSDGTTVAYYVFTSANASTIAGSDADLMTLTANTNGGSNYSYTVGDTGPTISGARALWLDQGTIAWNGTAGISYKLLFDPDGDMDFAAAEATACPAVPTAPCHLVLTASSTINGSSYPKNPNAGGLTRLTFTPTADQAKALLKGQLVAASYSSGGSLAMATGVQLQSVLDDLYVTNGSAASATLGPTYSGGTPTVSVWAPTARSVTLKRYADATTSTATDHPMTLDPVSGVWSVTGDSSWDRQYYLFDVEVYVPSTDTVEHNLVSDPYSVNLSADGVAAGDVRSQFVNLDDASLLPANWASTARPPLAAPEDIAVYEVHVRDFSRDDSTVPAAHRGTFAAFTDIGSQGMQHILALKDAGLTHIHLLPAFDIASVIEPVAERVEPTFPVPDMSRDSDDQQAEVGSDRATDSFNWGYDPFHYGAPEGSYSTNPADTSRILEFRQMVQTLHANGLRVVMDVVYNHTAESGQGDKSVFDKVVPGYYYRYDLTGVPANSSCCADTASEYAMFQKLMVDTVNRWARDYKVDSFRFDLMNLHTVENAVAVKDAVQTIDPTIYIYGEGWDFGSAATKGLHYAKQSNMTGTGIGTFNDRIRDAAHGGYNSDPLQIRHQGFINGLSYDWNGYEYDNRYQSDLHSATARLRTALAGSVSDYTDDPQETINYVEKHDNETLFDQNIFKMPSGATMAERVRAQNMGTSIVGLAQGIPFFQMGQDLMRSKSLDRNSYDSGDWFNRVDWSYSDGTYANNFGVGLPPAWDNSSRWNIMRPLLANTAYDPAASDAQATAAHLRETLRIRNSSHLFRLPTEAEINARVGFYNTENSRDGLIVMTLSDAVGNDLDPNWEYIVVLFNANKVQQSYTIGTLAGNATVALHPILADAVDADPVVQSSTFDSATGAFTIPARTTAVFVATQAPAAAATTIDWVGLMSPRGGVSHAINQGAFTPTGFDVFVRVYEAGLTEPAGAPSGIQCFLHWGRYGETWTDMPMTWNVQYGNDDEFKATIPQATLNGLAPGTYGFNAYCQKPGEDRRWKQDSYNIGGNALDDDQGDGIITIIPTTDSSAEPAGGVFVHLFEWRWADIQKECSYLADKGYTGVQISPPQEHVVPMADMGGENNDYPWWVRYQPVTHATSTFTSRSGTWTEFQSMVATCNDVGVDIIVDAVINHMADIEVGSPPTGTAGTQYETDLPGRFYGTQYDASDFYSPDCVISDYKDRRQVQQCQLSGLPDLNTGRAATQAKLRAYLQALVTAGVKGFRIDGAKHMAAQDIEAILDGVTGDFYVFQEVIDQSSDERVRDWEYTPNGDVTEFAYAFAIGYAFDDSCAGTLSSLESRFDDPDMLPSRFAQVFTDNHDNQRGHGVGSGCVVDHRDGQEHVLANIFVLAYPYGHPSVMSSYYWQPSPTDNSFDSYGSPTVNGGPGTGGATLPIYMGDDSVPDNCSLTYEWGKWACEHRRVSTANMVKFRRVTAGEPVTNWQTVNPDHIAFGRGSKGFVAINRSATAGGGAMEASFTYQTSMPAGIYCDITKYNTGASGTTRTCLDPVSGDPAPSSSHIIVDDSGQIVWELAANDAFAIHTDSRLDVALAVTIDSFTATRVEGDVALAWATVMESNLLGFNLLRGPSAAAPTETLNDALIPATGGTAGASYRFLDTQPLEGAYYWLESVDTSGTTERFGPITVETPTAITLGQVAAGGSGSGSWLAILCLGMVAGLLLLTTRRR